VSHCIIHKPQAKQKSDREATDPRDLFSEDAVHAYNYWWEMSLQLHLEMGNPGAVAFGDTAEDATLRAARAGTCFLRCTFNAEEMSVEWVEQQFDRLKLKAQDRVALSRCVGTNVALEETTSSYCEYIVRMVDRSKRNFLSMTLRLRDPYLLMWTLVFGG
jgi:hypothetical protein